MLRQAPETLWTIRVEIGYYLCIPIIVSCYHHAFNSKARSKARSLLFKSLFAFCSYYLLANYAYFNSFGYGYFTVFFPGSLFGILCHEARKEDANKFLKAITQPSLSKLYGILAVGIICLHILLEYTHSRNIMAKFLPIMGHYKPFRESGYLIGTLGALVIWLTVQAPQSYFSGCMSLPFYRFYGKISFSLYISHMMYFNWIYAYRSKFKDLAGMEGVDFFAAIDCTGN